jgi:hypothetical protein
MSIETSIVATLTIRASNMPKDETTTTIPQNPGFKSIKAAAMWLLSVHNADVPRTH